MRYKGGVISATPPTVSTASAKGLWTLEQQLQYQAAGVWPAQPGPPYIEDVFSTWLYTGTGSTQTITNGIDLSGKGGLVWIKGRSGVTGHRLTDTFRGATKSLESNSTAVEATESTGLTAFGSTGFTIGADADYNTNTATYVSWAFREQAKFFDVVTYTGNGSAGRQISHGLGSAPGCIIIKCTSNSDNWYVYHRSVALPNGLFLNLTAAAEDQSTRMATAPTSTVFTVETDAMVNGNGRTYVAYLFAHNAGGFGATGADNVISCGSYTGNGSSTGPVINLGYEPQWLLIKRTDSGGPGMNWFLFDNMRGMTVGGLDATLSANLSDAEFSSSDRLSPTATGFELTTASGSFNASGGTYIYIAIRRGPMKTPTSGTSVFKPQIGTGGSPSYTTNFTVDAVIDGYLQGGFSESQWVVDRLRGSVALASASTAAESSAYAANIKFDYSNGALSGINDSHVGWVLGRAPGFFDVVCYTGNGVTGRAITHNLTVTPEFIVVKTRSETGPYWNVYSATLGAGKNIQLNDTGAATTDSGYWNNTAPTATTFTLGSYGAMNNNGWTFVAYLFATVAGVSKVGSYTGTGTTQQVNCGFTGGARFVLIKRTDSTGDWYVWDSARGIVAGNDPYLLLNSTAAEVTNTDYVDTFAAGFEISSTAPAAINANGGTFIFLAIA